MEKQIYMVFLDFLNTNSAAVQGIAILLLVAVTLWYAISNHRLVVQMRGQSRPYVILDFEMSETEFSLSVANIGNRPAYNVNFEVTRDIVYTDSNKASQKLSELPVMQEGIHVLNPGRRLLFWFTGTHSLLRRDSGQNLRFEAIINYSYGKSYSETFDFDLTLYREGMLFKSFQDDVTAVKSSINELTRTVRGLPREFRESRWFMSPIHASNVKKCPICSEEINIGAKKCPKCLEWLNGKEESHS